MLSLTYEPFVIITACQAESSVEENFKNTMLLKSRLKTAKPVYGVFKGQVENSFYVPCTSDNEAVDLAREFNQDCVLVVDQFRRAKLLFVNGAIEELGTWQVGDSDTEFTIIDGVKWVCK